MKLELIATATFGLEAVVRREVEALGFKITGREDGRITYIANEAGVARSNLWLRCADRVYIKLAAFPATEFEDLYQNTRAIPFEEILPLDADFSTEAVSVRSKLHAVPSIQSVCEKAVVDRMREAFSLPSAARLTKSGAKYKIRITVQKDQALLALDTSGAGLHKRGYRKMTVDAPIKETLAAALVELSFWNRGRTSRLLVDPCCGSGTIPIEAALIGRNIAPGLQRKFAAEAWDFIPQSVWKQERANAYRQIDHSCDLKIEGSDISRRAVEAAMANAAEAGVEDCITFSVRDIADFGGGGIPGAPGVPDTIGVSGAPGVPDTTGIPGAPGAPAPRGVMVCNPPYGERIGDAADLARIYASLRDFFGANPDWSLFLLTTDKDFEQVAMGRPADRRRKLYNGRLETTLYQYHGARPRA